MTDPVRRFSLRHGIEAEPEQPIFEDAPKRLRYFALEFLKNHFYDYCARELTARVLCIPELLTTALPRMDSWNEVRVHIDQCKWWELYNLLEGMYADLPMMSNGVQPKFVEQLNLVFAEESIGWQMNSEGRLQRQLPEAVRTQEETIFRQLHARQYSTALAHVQSSRQAYNDRPRRDREVCSEIFDALESVAKEVFSMPTATFGDVLKAARAKAVFAPETLASLEKIYALANNHFRHGMTTPFDLTAAEVELVYLSSMGGILLFIRYSQKLP